MQMLWYITDAYIRYFDPEHHSNIKFSNNNFHKYVHMIPDTILKCGITFT